MRDEEKNADSLRDAATKRRIALLLPAETLFIPNELEERRHETWLTSRSRSDRTFRCQQCFATQRARNPERFTTALLESGRPARCILEIQRTRMSAAPLLTVKQLTPESFSPFGWVLGKAIAIAGDKPFFKGATLSMWREHLFDTGAPNKTEIVWGNFSDDDPIVRTLETRLLTQQAVVPLTGPLIQIVAASNESGGPDIHSIRAFEIPIGMGTCVRPGCWHAIRVSKGEVMALLLSRQSTTYDLIVHLHTGCPTAESSRNSIVPRRVVLKEVESNEIVDVA